MRRTNLLAAILVAGVAGIFMFASTALADTMFSYTFNSSAPTQVTLTSNGDGTFSAQLGSGGSLSGYGSVYETGENPYGPPESSTYSFSTSSTGTFGPEVGTSGIYPVSGFTSQLTITDTADYDVGGTSTVTWTFFDDGTVSPRLFGTVSFNGVNYIIDLTLSNIGQYLDSFALTSSGTTTSSAISSGELDLTPEPMSMLLMMFGFAMIGLVAIRRRPAAIDRLA